MTQATPTKAPKFTKNQQQVINLFEQGYKIRKTIFNNGDFKYAWERNGHTPNYPANYRDVRGTLQKVYGFFYDKNPAFDKTKYFL